MKFIGGREGEGCGEKKEKVTLYIIITCVSYFPFLIGLLPAWLCSVEDITDLEVKQKLIDIRSSNDEGAFLAQVREFPQRLDFGYNKPNPKLSDKDELLKTVAHHFIISVKF